MLSIKKASDKLGVHPQTLRRWEREGKIIPHRTAKGQRRYNVDELLKLVQVPDSAENDTRSKIIYARVSSKKQEDDLKRQIMFMEKLFPDYEVISDICSGVNFNRPGLRKVLERLCRGNISKIAISYKDRLCRIGFDLFEQLGEIYSTEIIVVNNTDTSPEEELVEDLIAITTSFSARMHGLRKYAKEMSRHSTKGEKEDQDNNEGLDIDVGTSV
jgi:putative resolvase